MPEYGIVDERFRSLVLGNAGLETLVGGCRWLEGPVWFADHRILLASDIPNDRILRITEAGEVAIHRQPADFPNGQARDREGRLVGCSHLLRAIVRTELDGRQTVLVDRHRGKRLNAPNDLVVRVDGTIWFSDPPYGIESNYEGEKATPEGPPAVYCFEPASGRLTCVADDFEGPNGLAFSPDERRLYVAETGHQFAAAPHRHLRVFDASAPGETPSLAGGAVFHTIEPGYSDGFKIDADGRLWSSAGDGVHCIDPGGALLGKIIVPGGTSNLCFGGRLMSRLFLCAGQSLHVVSVNVRGAPWP